MGRTVLGFISSTSNPSLRAVFAEDAAALMGLPIAGCGVFLHQLTGSPVPDAIGSIAVGVLLAVVAVFQIDPNRRFLVGEALRPDVRERVLRGLLERPDIDRMAYLHLEFLGPGRMYLVAAVGMTGDEATHQLAIRLRRLEQELEQAENIE